MADNRHFVSACCKGETCRCGRPATHKVGEEIPHGDPAALVALPWRHNFTAYVCCACFRALFGDAVFCPEGGPDRLRLLEVVAEAARSAVANRTHVADLAVALRRLDAEGGR